MLHKLTDSIHTAFSSSLYTRANYLYDAYNIIRQNVVYLNYLDVGCGYGVNSSVFGRFFSNTICLDFDAENLEECRNYNNPKINKNIFLIRGDAHSLPFKNKSFDLVTAFSLIEHISNKEVMLSEMLRVLKSDGELLLQFPNKYFFIDLHTGIPFFSLFPHFLRILILKKKGYKGEIGIPNLRKIKSELKDIKYPVKIVKIKINYPIEMIPQKFRLLYRVLKGMRVLYLVPMGIMVCFRKIDNKDR